VEDLDLEMVEVEVEVEPEVFDSLCMVVVSHSRSLCAGKTLLAQAPLANAVVQGWAGSRR